MDREVRKSINGRLIVLPCVRNQCDDEDERWNIEDKCKSSYPTICREEI